jgi:hypothetical protein
VLSGFFDLERRIEKGLRARRLLDDAVPERTDTLAEDGPVAILDGHAELFEVLNRIGLDLRGPIPMVRSRLLHGEQQTIPQRGLEALQRTVADEGAERGIDVARQGEVLGRLIKLGGENGGRVVLQPIDDARLQSGIDLAESHRRRGRPHQAHGFP